MGLDFGKGNTRPEQVHGGTMPEVKATCGTRTGASLHDDAGVEGKPVDNAQDLLAMFSTRCVGYVPVSLYRFRSC